MIGEKVRHYQGKNIDLGTLQSKIESYLKDDGFNVQSSKPSPHGILIQAYKGGFLRSVIAADRAFNILLDGEPGNFTVRVGIGKWLKNLEIAAVETLLLTDLFLLVDVSEMAWNLEVEDKILKQIDAFVG